MDAPTLPSLLYPRHAAAINFKIPSFDLIIMRKRAD
jgi:hypothetical protein